MRIIGASSSVSTRARPSAVEAPDGTAPQAPGRTLITVEPPRRDERSAAAMRHPSAAFVAHLLATRMQAPQTRARRRAEPDEAIAVYRSMTKPVAQKRVFGTRA